MRTEAEVYRFTWCSSFDGDAVVRIERQGEEMTLRCVYRSSLFGDADRRQVPVTMSDWRGLEDALIAASFWALNPEPIDGDEQQTTAAVIASRGLDAQIG
jgi:hypothetical protein